MNELQELYQDLIMDHGRTPRNFGELATANCVRDGYNPICGDQITVYLEEKNGLIEAIQFKGKGCAISVASASLMTEALRGKTLDEARIIFEDFRDLVMTGDEKTQSKSTLGKLSALKGVSAFPARVKCATLCWHTLVAVLNQQNGTVCTE